jgi:hypothetical protein
MPSFPISEFIKPSDREFTAIVHCKHLVSDGAWNAKETIFTRVGVGSEIVDFTNCSPNWRMTSIIAPCEL